jgi:hypothetical protein
VAGVGDGSATVAGVGDGSAAAAGVSGCSSGGLGVTCSCLSFVVDGVEAAGVGAPEMARAGMAAQFGSLLPYMLMRDSLRAS